MLEERKIGNAAEQMEVLKLENNNLKKDIEGYKKLAEARGKNNKKFDEENQKLKAEISDRLDGFASD